MTKGAELSRREVTEMISALLENHIDPHNDPRIYWAKKVTFDYATEHSIRVDYMMFKPANNSVSGIEHGDFFCYEVKSSVEDFRSKNGHNFIGDFNYYVMPEDVFEAVKYTIPYDIGVFVPSVQGYLYRKKMARRRNRSRPVGEMLLMMWRSSRREIVNARRKSAMPRTKEVRQ